MQSTARRGAWPPRHPREFHRLVRAVGRAGRSLTGVDLAARASGLRASLQPSQLEPSHVVEAFALAREAAVRGVGQRPFDVQIHGGLALAAAAIAEMQTGEGKTLAAVAPAFLLSLWRGGVHVLTANDYLARRDAEWMRPAYELLGLNVACIQQGMSLDERRAAYAADVTYATATEVGFDYLRDRLATSPEELVLRPFRAVIVDEVDSILIDEARVPLVVAGGESAPPATLLCAAKTAAALRQDEDYEADLDSRTVRFLRDVPSDVPDDDLVRALCAKTFARRDVEYVVREEPGVVPDGGSLAALATPPSPLRRIEIVDEFKGRTDPMRRWPDGFHGAVEAQEGIEPTPEGRILSTITLQSLIRLYPYRAGMTATASASRDELRDLYGLSVVPVPPNRKCVRKDAGDIVFEARDRKEDALVSEIRHVHRTGRPILVGTGSVAESERLAARLRTDGVGVSVLNALNDALEASIVAEAGAPGAVTISTNMAGRGTDIRLGGSDESRADAVRRLGGLYVIGTNRHDARRIDQQLRGRAGRQGDPGVTRFFISLEDPLFVRHRSGELLAKVHRLSIPDGGPSTSRRVRNVLTEAQETIDWIHSRIRSHLAAFGDLVERQRVSVHAWREDVLHLAFGFREPRPRIGELRASHGDEFAKRFERDITLACIDEGWADHLAVVRALQQDAPTLAEFRSRAEARLNERLRSIRERIDGLVDTCPLSSDGADLAAAGIARPSAKWTYLMGEVPMRSELYWWFPVLMDMFRSGFGTYTSDELAASQA